MKSEKNSRNIWLAVLWRPVRGVIIAVISLLLVFGVVNSVWKNVNESLFSCVEPSDSQEVAFSVAAGSSLSKVARQLAENGLIRSSTAFKFYCDFAGLGQKIQSGDYILSRNMDMFTVADKITRGDGKPITMDITIIPGMNAAEIAEYLQKKGLFTSDTASEFLSICKTGEGVKDYYFISELLESKKGVKNRIYLLEGYLAADTYEVYLNAKPLEIVRKLLSQTDRIYPEEYQKRAEELGFTMDQIFTLASMIEKEAGKGDFAKVSAVFHNRLKKKMKLQSDPTVHYVTGERRMSLRQSDIAVASPYNTYSVTGLPEGPICCPSPDALKAALYPDEVYVKEQYLYFCATDPESGEMCFAKTLEEHNRNVEQYRPLWEEYDQKRGL